VSSQDSRDSDFIAFEQRLMECFAKPGAAVFEWQNIKIGVEVAGTRGEITVSLAAQDMRDFGLADSLPKEARSSFAEFLAEKIKESGATRLRIGPLGGESFSTLKKLLDPLVPEFLFTDAILSIEPLILKTSTSRLPESLRRALKKAEKSGWIVDTSSFDPIEMEKIHSARWGKNRSPAFFEALRKFAGDPYGDCITIRDASGRILAQQIDFNLDGQRYYYYAAARHAEFPGIGTVLLAESIRRFLDDPKASLYSFGRGGETYKYRYANRYRRNHYLVGYRTNGCEEL
jgi:hypothetical protein